MIKQICSAIAFTVLVGCQSMVPHSSEQALTEAMTPRTLAIESQAWAGSSVNVLANTKQTLFTHSVHQYGAFYDDEGFVVLAKRRIGEDEWTLKRTTFKGHVEDAHNHISLIVDGEGLLHLSWDHHNNPLNYAVAEKPGSLQLKRSEMLGSLEQSVTYPQFYRTPDGDLLFLYRDGGSGNGNLVMNRYDVEHKSWLRVSDNLIDGEGKRNAYWDLYVDDQGNLHLAWVWRESPNVASNHDLSYAKSFDGGKSWQTIEGKALPLPIKHTGDEVVYAIEQNHNLMNPPVVSADWQGNPLINSYWSDAPEQTPQHRVVAYRDGQWLQFKAPSFHKAFTLAGEGTKNPTISRAALLVESNWQGTGFHLLYRDNSQQAIIGASLDDITQPKWTVRKVAAMKGGWEPSIDPQQWRRLRQAQLLMQQVTQLDGDDQSGAESQVSPVELLIWSPVWERLQDLSAKPEGSMTAEPELMAPVKKSAVVAKAKAAALWQWQHPPVEHREYLIRSWIMAPFYMGSLAMDAIIPEAKLAEKVKAVGEETAWSLNDNVYDADEHAVVQAYLELYLKERDPAMIAPAKARFDAILAKPSGSVMDWGLPVSRHRWTWSDALFMGPVSWLMMYQATGEQAYLDFMEQEWQATTDRLYRPEIGLYFRDESYLDLREQNGKTIHWARGTGWSIAGLARVLERLPKEHPSYSRYAQQLKEMAAAFAEAQQSDGLWRPGLLDPKTHHAKETSGSSFAVFAIAWGMNNGLLDKDTYLPTVTKGWNALAKSVTPEGKLQHVQPIGAAPYGFDPKNNEPFGTGAFLLAASEVYQLAQ